MNGSCHCGRVTVRVPGRPDFVNACNCSFCMKLGGLWGYYAAGAAEVAGEVRSYRRADTARPTIEGRFCGECGATIGWVAAQPDAAGRSGINMRLFDPAELAGVEVRYEDRRHHGHGDGRAYRAPTIFDGMGDVA